MNNNETKNNKVAETKTTNKKESTMNNNETKNNKVEELVIAGIDPKIVQLAAGITSNPMPRKTSSDGAGSKIVELTKGLLEVNRILHGVTKVTFGEIRLRLQHPDCGIAYCWATPKLDKDGKPVEVKTDDDLIMLTKEEAQQAVIDGKKVIEHQLLEDPYRGIMHPLRNNFLELKGKAGNRTGKAKAGKLPPGWTIRYVEGGKGEDAISFVYVG